MIADNFVFNTIISHQAISHIGSLGLIAVLSPVHFVEEPQLVIEACLKRTVLLEQKFLSQLQFVIENGLLVDVGRNFALGESCHQA